MASRGQFPRNFFVAVATFGSQGAGCVISFGCQRRNRHGFRGFHGFEDTAAWPQPRQRNETTDFADSADYIRPWQKTLLSKIGSRIIASYCFVPEAVGNSRQKNKKLQKSSTGNPRNPCYHLQMPDFFWECSPVVNPTGLQPACRPRALLAPFARFCGNSLCFSLLASNLRNLRNLRLRFFLFWLRPKVALC